MKTYKPFKDVLQPMKKQPVIFGIAETYSAYLRSRDSYDTFHRAVLDHFFASYYPLHAEKIGSIIADIAERNDEILVSSLAGKICNKLPIPLVPDHKGDYRQEYARLIIATTVCHCLMDSGVYRSSIEHKRNHEGKWETLTYLFLGGEQKKDLLKGIHHIPGVFTQTRVNNWKISGKSRKRAKRLASIPFMLSDVASEDLIYHFYTLKEDWNKRVDKFGNPLLEDHNSKVQRYKGYASLIDSLADDPLYFEVKYSDSGRMFYRAQLEGIRPQGKTWETLMIDSYRGFYLTFGQIDVLRHIIYANYTGDRVVQSVALANFKDEIVDECLLMNPFECTDEDSATRALLLYKAATALRLAEKGEAVHYMFGFDFTNSGLIMAGLSFKSKEMLNAGNIHDGTDVVDMHTEFGKSFGLDIPRKDIKKLHMPLLHGASWKGLAKKFTEVTGKTVGVGEIRSKVEAAYGPCAYNLVNIAEWGIDALHNEQTKLSWTLPDGFKAGHKAYFESVSMKVTVPSANKKHEKASRTTHTLIRNMPYCMDNKRQPLIQVEGKAPKIRGLYANITHSLDSYVLRCVVDVLLDMDVPVLLKHDDYMINPSCYEVVLQESRKAFQELYSRNLYAEAVAEIAHWAKEPLEVPEIAMGDAQDVVEDAEAFLMP